MTLDPQQPLPLPASVLIEIDDWLRVEPDWGIPGSTSWPVAWRHIKALRDEVLRLRALCGEP